MKCAILAAGKGVRMMPLTRDLPKPLIEVAGRPFLDYLLENVKGAGFDDIAMIVGYKNEKIRRWVSISGEKIHFIEQMKQKGTGHAIGLLREWSAGEDFLVVMGDNLYSSRDLKELWKEDRQSLLSMRKDPKRKYGEVVVDSGGFLIELREKPEDVKSGLINLGAYKFTSEIFDEIDKLEESERGEIEITDALTVIAENGKVKVKEIEDYWINFGSVEDVEIVEKFVKENFGKV